MRVRKIFEVAFAGHVYILSHEHIVKSRRGLPPSPNAEFSRVALSQCRLE
jgi:hypothetical protein